MLNTTFSYLYTFLFLLLSFASMPLLGQETDSIPSKEETLSARAKRTAIARVQINDLKAGTLIVRIPSNARKIYATQKLLDSPNISEKSRKRLEKQLEETTEESNENATALMSAFSKSFNFTKVLFMYDYSTKPLLEGEREGLFLSEAQKVDANLRLTDENFFILRLGKAQLQGEDRLDALVMMDAQGDDLYKPFPYYLRMNTIAYLLDQLFSPSQAFAKNIESRVRKFNARLHNFYRDMQEVPRP